MRILGQPCEFYLRHARAAEPRLRERAFGELDGTPDAPDLPGSLGGYHAVWAADVRLGLHAEFGTESVYAVLRRVTALIAHLEAEAAESGAVKDSLAVVLVGHGDVLQILQAGFEVRPTRITTSGLHFRWCLAVPRSCRLLALVREEMLCSALMGGIQGRDARLHRELDHLPNAEPRVLTRWRNQV